MRPLAVDLFSGLGGWTEGLTAAGWYVIRFDLEDMCRILGEPQSEHSSLVIQDVLTLHGAQFKDVGLIVSSSPCQDFSYRAMPWKRAKALHAPFLGMFLFWRQFRIQREACEAAGRHIPMVVENVRGAQPWVGRAQATWGSIALWGDVPALLPYGRHRKLKGDNGPRMWSDRRVARLADEFRYDSDDFFCASSGALARKAASAKIAKIPFVLAHWIGRASFPSEKIAA